MGSKGLPDALTNNKQYNFDQIQAGGDRTRRNKKHFFFKAKASETLEPCRDPNIGLNLPMDALLINPSLAQDQTFRLTKNC